jgi:hypothetical protein
MGIPDKIFNLCGKVVDPPKVKMKTHNTSKSPRFPQEKTFTQQVEKFFVGKPFKTKGGPAERK